MISQLKKNLDIVSIIESSGVELKRHGRRFIGLCPFHSEKTPSFTVFDDGGFKCFGCGQSGDVISFVQKMYGMSFPDALAFLKIETGEISPQMRRNIEQRKLERRKADAKKQFRSDLQNTLLILISSTHKAAQSFNNIDALERYGEILQPLPYWEHCLDVLAFGTSEEQDFVCQQLKDEEVLPVKGFFKSDFDYQGWLRNFLINENLEMGCNENDRNTKND